MSAFGSKVRDWFLASFAEPTPAQKLAWPAISSGEHVLLSAPTGSGKTLAAFLWALDRLSRTNDEHTSEDLLPVAPKGVRVVYVSPLKALSYDIERNLRAPLRGIGANIRVGIRTGDTSQAERAAMVRNPPDILITTPESLYLILGSRARSMLRRVETVIVDEIHALASVKRGAHLALTLERLEEHALAGRRDAIVQRVGLSATQNPLEEVGRFMVGPGRKVRILDTKQRKPLDLRIHVPVDSMTEPDRLSFGAPERDPLEPLPGGESTRGSLWPAIYPELLRLLREHRSTIVFVNNRRSAERVALRLNEMARAEEQTPAEQSEFSPEQASVDASSVAHEPTPTAGVTSSMGREIARAHHGSLSREERTIVEEQLKAGELPCLVATSSLELGIDMGAVDLVVQIESPKSVARGLQRIGRAGHGVEEVSKGRIFPKFRGDLLECAVVCRRMREGAIEQTVVPRNALDVLAQQIVAIAASAEDAALAPEEPGRIVTGSKSPTSESPRSNRCEGSVPVDDLYALLKRTHSYAELPRTLLENVLDMLDGRYPSSEFGELRPRIVWDRLAGCIRARKGARQLSIANAGTIPDRGLYAVTLPDGRRVGELDEEMVYEARPGQVFLLGASSWRIEEIGRDRVIVTPAPGVPGAVPFWKGDGIGRPKELGAAIGAFTRWAVDQDAEVLVRDYDLDERSANNLLEYLREQQAATQVLPSDRTIVLERFRDEIGDWRLCVLSPYGGRVHAAWGLAISTRIRERCGIDGEAIWSDDGIIVRLPDVDPQAVEDSYRSQSPDEDAAWTAGGTAEGFYADLVVFDPEEIEEAIVAELGSSALFGARFRENAGRALLIPRAYPGRRTPLWQQRLKAQSLLEVARHYPDFPIVLETYRECLRDVLDVPGLIDLMRGLTTRELSLVEVQTQSASPFAGSLLFDYVATYMYESDTPNAERRAAALSLDRELLRELLGQEELRELIDPVALARVEDELQHRSPHTQATGADALSEVLRHLGDLAARELEERVLDGLDARALLDGLERERRVVRVRIAGEERFIAADDAGLYRDALGVVPPGGLPNAFLADVPDALATLVGRYARTHGPFTTSELFERYGVDVSAALRERECSGELVRGELRPAAAMSAETQSSRSHSQQMPDSESTKAQALGSSQLPSRERDGREWCDVGVLRRLRRASLAVLRKEIEPVGERALTAFMPSWQGIGRWAPSTREGSGGVQRLREALVVLQGLALPVSVWERDVLPSRTGSYSPTWLDSLCASGEIIWVGAGPLGRDSGRVALYFREDAPMLGPPHGVRTQPSEPEHTMLRERLAAGPCFFGDLLAELEYSASTLARVLWDLVWAGEVTNDAWAPLRAPRLTLAPAGVTSARRAGTTRTLAMPSRQGPAAGRSSLRGGRFAASGQLQGRWSRTAPVFESKVFDVEAQRLQRRALAELLLERYGVLTREHVVAEGIAGGFSAVYGALTELETLGVCRRGYFVEGLGGAQFALPGAVERLRMSQSAPQGSALVLAAVDPAQPYGATLAWPRRENQPRGPSRVAGAYVAFIDSQPALYLERGGRGILTLSSSVGEGAPLLGALRALAEGVRAGRLPAIALERVDGQPAIGCELEPILVELGFQQGPRRLTLRA
jgi:ATP-dependent helicase Lhr and Lhr-like helicase